MADILNLRRFKKLRNREKAAQTAAENRQRFGKTKAEKSSEALTNLRADKHLAGHRLTTEEPKKE